jgi:hypothetical protein
LINSGYNPVEVQEASNYVGGGILGINQPRQGEKLIPDIQNTRGSFRPWKKPKEANQDIQPPKLPPINQKPAEAVQQPPYPSQQQNIKPQLYPQQSRTIPQQRNQLQIQKTISQQVPLQQNQQPGQDSLYAKLNISQAQSKQDSQQMMINQSKSQSPEIFSQTQPSPLAQEIPQVQNQIPGPEPIAQQSERIRPKRSYAKEIILLIILLILIGLLIATIMFRQTIIGWFA